MNKTKIEYLDYTWSPVTGCTKVSDGCTNCWREAISKRFGYPQEVTLYPERLDQPLRKKTPCRIGVCFMGDLFHEDVPDKFIDKINYTTGVKADWHTYLMLTKRIERAYYYISKSPFHTKNWWLGVSVEDQKTADKRIPQIPAAVRWVSMEPLLERIRLYDFLMDRIDWIVIGCESGAKRRPCKIEWVEKVVQDCKDAGKPVFVKQLNIGGKVVRDIDQFPEHLRIRELPDDTEG